MDADGNKFILVVDDDLINREIIMEFLDGQDYHFVEAENGQQAWDTLCQSPTLYDVVLLDRMMPVMDGLTLLSKLRSDSRFRYIPVILQTARAVKSDVQEGIDAGAFFYLSKPFDDDILCNLVKAAVADSLRYQNLEKLLHDDALTKVSFDEKIKIQSLEEAERLAVRLAKSVPRPEQSVIGIYELLVNGIEHGNLAIDYEAKSKLLSEGRWQEEITLRLSCEENKDKYLEVELSNDSNSPAILIRDQGQGFNWQEYLTLTAARGHDTHGRGIAVATNLSMIDIQYRAPGNEVLITIT